MFKKFLFFSLAWNSIFYPVQLPEDFCPSLSYEDQIYIENFPLNEYKICTIPIQGSFYIDRSDDFIKGCLAEGTPWELQYMKLMKNYIRPGSIALDIGSHIGTYTMFMSHLVRNNGYVIAFEPQAKIFRELYKNIQLNDRKNIIPLHLALGNKEEIVYMGEIEPHNEGGRSIQESGIEPVLMRTLDSFHFENISFIKIDVENMEDELLEGAKETLQRNKPVLFIEIQGNDVLINKLGYDRKEKTEKTIQLLHNLGYKVQLFSGCNYVAIPT